MRRRWAPTFIATMGRDEVGKGAGVYCLESSEPSNTEKLKITLADGVTDKSQRGWRRHYRRCRVSKFYYGISVSMSDRLWLERNHIHNFGKVGGMASRTRR